MSRTSLVTALALLLALSPVAEGQAPSVPLRWVEATVDAEAELLIRVQELAGVIPSQVISLRPLSPAQIENLDGEIADTTMKAVARPRRVIWVAPRATMVFNSAVPYGLNDGAVWAGRGITGALTGGVAGRVGPLYFSAVPTLFLAENREFDLAPTGFPDRLAFADPRNALAIDQPQRFGAQRYGRVDLGATTVQVVAGPLTAGVSTANQTWGPTIHLPLVLGRNAPGFPHAFLGTSTPVRTRLGSVHARFTWGHLRQSQFAASENLEAHRFTTGAVIAYAPPGISGLELGAARFFHNSWSEEGLRAYHLLQPFEALFKAALPDNLGGADGRSGPENQLASAFARWAFPRSGFEIFGEFARNDHNWDLRDYLLEPDHASAYTLGAQRVWKRGAGRYVVFRAEVLNAHVSHLNEVRPQGDFYRHREVRQGHTHRGQILGSPAAYGGGGSILVVEHRAQGQLVRGSWHRTHRHPDGDVLHALLGEVTRPFGMVALTTKAGLIYNLSRNLGSDVAGLHMGFTLGTAR
jgi:hypothetical protein